MPVVLVETNRVGNLDRHGPDSNVKSEATKPSKQFVVKRGNRLRPEGQDRLIDPGGLNFQLVIDEIERDSECASIGFQPAGRETSRRHLKRHVPEVIQSWCAGERDFADHLRPHVQRRVRVAPLIQW